MPAGITPAASHHRFDHDQVAALKSAHVRSHLNDRPADFMAAHQRISRVRVASGVVLHITRADPGGERPEQHVGGPTAWGGPITYLQLLRSAKNQGLHGKFEVRMPNG